MPRFPHDPIVRPALPILARALAACALAACMIPVPAPLLAQTEPKNKTDMAITDVQEAGEDFAIQGEYAGFAGCSCCGGYGVQVIAMGDSRFEAAVYPGGLPGAGWNGCPRGKLKGAANEGILRLQGDDYQAEVTGGRCRLSIGHQGAWIMLPKIARVSPTMHRSAPPNAVVLFDGTTPTQLEGAHLTKDGFLATGTLTKLPVHDFHLHLEFRTPFMPFARGQARGNSGVYIQQRYEIQILDSFGLEGVENECGGIYRQIRPDLNMCLPPLSWQTYDIHFQAARWSATGQKIQNARITVFLNGVAVHYHREIRAKTGAGKEEGPDPRPILLQHHGNPVAFRNIWLVTPEPSQLVAANAGCCIRMRNRPIFRGIWRRR